MPASRLIPVDKIHVVTYRLLRPDSDCEYHHRARNRASQSRSAWGDGRFTWSFSAHRTGRLFRLDVRFCHETSYAQTCLFVYELHPWRLVTWEECVKK